MAKSQNNPNYTYTPLQRISGVQSIAETDRNIFRSHQLFYTQLNKYKTCTNRTILRDHFHWKNGVVCKFPL